MRRSWFAGALPVGASLGRDAGAALVVGLSALSFYVSCASLLFQGALAVHLPSAIGAALAGGALLSLACAWRGSLPRASAGAVSTSVPLFAALTAGIAANAAPGSALPTAVVGLAVTAALIGLAWWWMGRQGWGGLAGFVPYPVIGGFMAATGWLLLSGGVSVAAGQRFSAPVLQAWLAGGADARLAVGVASGVVIAAVCQRVRHPLTLPVLLIAGVGVIHAGLALAGLGLEDARAQGWLPPRFEQALPVWPWQPQVWSAVQWDVLLQQAGWMAAAVIVCTLNLVLTTSSLELAWNARGDLDADLRTLGQANLVAVLAGALAGGLSLSRSVLNQAAGAQGRASGVMLALLCLAAMAWGGGLIAAVPLPLLGGLLLAQGLELLKAWLLDNRRLLSRRDQLTVLGMLAVTALLGFLPAVCLGVLACCVDFAVTQAQFSPLRRRVLRADWLSSVERSPQQAHLLMQHGHALQIIELQGVLFFGSASRLCRQLDPVLTSPPVPRALVVDFRHVRSLDSSAAQALARWFRAAAQHGVVVELTGLHGPQEAVLRAAGALSAAAPLRHATLDDAVAAWDEAVLAARPAPESAASGAEAALAQHGGAEWARRLLPVFQRRTLAPGEVLFERGDEADRLYLVHRGRLGVVVPGDGGAGEVTVRTVMPGSALGEMGLFRDAPRSATVRALEASEVLELCASRLAGLEAEDPPAAAALYRLVVLQMASRLDQLTRQAHLLAR